MSFTDNIMKTYAFIQWEDQFVDVLDTSKIKEPRKELSKYVEGEYIVAPYKGKLYRAIISEISEDRSYLLKKRDAQPPKLKHKFTPDHDNQCEGTSSKAKVSKKSGVDKSATNSGESGTGKSSAVCPRDDQLQFQAQQLMIEKLLSKARTSQEAENSTVGNQLKSKRPPTLPTVDLAEDVITEHQKRPRTPTVPSGTEEEDVNQSLTRFISHQEEATNDPKKAESEYVTRKEFNDLLEKFSKLKQRVRDLEKPKKKVSPPQNVSGNTPGATSPTQVSREPLLTSNPQVEEDVPATTSLGLYNGKTFEELEDSVCHCDKLFNCVHNLLTQLFSTDYICSHSVSGQASNKTTVPKPKFDSRLYDVMVAILNKKFPRITKPEITQTVQCVQKKYLLKKKQKMIL